MLFVSTSISINIYINRPTVCPNDLHINGILYFLSYEEFSNLVFYCILLHFNVTVFRKLNNHICHTK